MMRAAAGDSTEPVPAFPAPPAPAVPESTSVLQKQLLALNVTADFATIESLRLNIGKVIEINPTTRLQRDKQGNIQRVSSTDPAFTNVSRKVKLRPRVTKTALDGCALTFQIKHGKGTAFPRGGRTESFDADKIGRSIIVRHWQRGDRLHLIGAKSARKLQDIFIDLKIPREKRHTLVVGTTADNEIFWVEGLRISENFKIAPKTKRQLIWTWR